MLSPVLLERLRTWWRVARAQGKMLTGGWLFPGQNPIEGTAQIILRHGIKWLALSVAKLAPLP